MKTKPVARLAICLALVLAVTACGGTASRSTIMVCDPECSERPVKQVNQDLRYIEQDDGRMAALEADAEKNPLAAYDLSLRYFRGDGVPRSTYKALTWMRAAADKGDLEAQKALGSLYLTGYGEMGADPGEAQIWLSMAASRGDQEAKQLLAEAEAANRSNKDSFKSFERQRSLIQQMWGSGYSYTGAWNGNAWNYGRSGQGRSGYSGHPGRR